MVRRKKDWQRSRVYGWEAAATAGASERRTLAGVEQAQALVDAIWKREARRYGVHYWAPPDVTLARPGGVRAWARLTRRVIQLPDWALNPWSVFHETAHFLNMGRSYGHGPRFVGILIGVAHRAAMFPVPYLLDEARRQGVKVSVRAVGKFDPSVTYFLDADRGAAMMEALKDDI